MFVQDVPLDRFNLVANDPRPPDHATRKAIDDLLNSLVLSDNAKKFLIARELQRGLKGRHVYEALFPVLFLTASGPVLFGIKGGIAGRNPISKGLALMLSAGSVLMVYFWFSDWWHRKTDQMIDAAAAELGVEYALGGAEFYDKMLLRHRSLRDLLPEKRGMKLYNLKGETFPGLLRDKTLPISTRRDFCRKTAQRTPE